MTRFGLFGKYLALIVALVTGALVVSSFAKLWFTYKESKSAITALQREKAIAAAYRIEEYVRSIEHSITWTTLPRALESVSAAEQRRIEFLKLLRQEPAITEVQWIDRAGREQLRVSRLAMDVAGSGDDLSNEPRFIEARKNKTYFGPVYFRKETEPYMTIAHAGTGGDGGVTAIEVNLKFVWDVVSQIKIGQAGLAYVVDARGRLIAHPDISLVLQKLDWSSLPQVAAARAAAEPGAEQQGGLIARNRAGREMLSASAAIPTLGWLVLTEVPLEEAYAPLIAEIYRSAFLLLIGLVLSVAASIMLARRMVQPIRALQEGAQKIGAGDLEYQLAVKTGDELETLAGQFNKMTADLRESYAGLERKVEERTRELKDSLDRQTATGEILRVISNSPTDDTPVLEAVAHNAARLCSATNALIWRAEGEALRLVTIYWAAGEEQGLSLKLGDTIPLSAKAVTARAVRERTLIHIKDVAAVSEEEFGETKARALAQGYRTALAMPLMREGEAVGAIFIRRPDVAPFSDDQIALLGTFSDQAAIAIENVRLFHEIKEKSAQLEEASQHKSQFLASMSHELRTPLNAILGFNEMMLDGLYGELSEGLKEPLEETQKSGKHLLHLINNVLDLAKIEAGRMELAPSDYLVHDIVDSVRATLRPLAEAKGLALGTSVAADLPLAYGDSGRLTQCLMNLAGNALKFTKAGSVDIAVKLNGDNRLRYQVTDTGIGIAPDKIDSLFTEFKQTDATIASEYGGTGLGLSITKKFVEMHGGRIWIESALGKGSSFIFEVPLRIAR